VTTKPDQGSGAPEPTARSADLTPDDDRHPVDSLPSIIVDPAAFAAVAHQREDERNSDSLQTNDGPPEATAEAQPAPPAPNGAAHAHEHGAGEHGGDDAQPASEDRLSVEEAERFAEHFRPSWESLPPAVAAPVQTKARVVVVTPEPSVALESVLPRRQRRRGLIMVGVAVCAFAALTALAMMSASHDGLPDQEATAPAPGVSKPSAAPSAAPAPPPVTQPAPAAIPAAAAPSAIATAGAGATAPSAAVATTDLAPAVPADPAAALPAADPSAAPSDLAGPSAAAAPPAAVPQPPLQAVTPAAAPQAAPAQATVRIQLKTVPTSATLLIDGTKVANPFDAMLEKSGNHRIQAEAPGYRESDFTLNFDRPRDLSLRLQKVRPVRKPARRAAATRAPAPARAPAPSREAAKFSVRPAAEPPAEPAKPAPAAPKPAKGAGFVSESPY
jgi:nicotinate-nucleotide--dimethylbenzimidazole phosphoribosyltransferase